MKRRAVSWLVIISLIYNPGIPCFANPTGGSVVGGDQNGTITGTGTGVTTINQHGNRIIINWQNFSIGSGEITRFLQPSAHSWALNRVISGNPSLIYGSLQANGHVVVINQNGILVGAGGRIDTKGFFASTLDVKDSSFMKGGTLTLSGDSTASVRNEGTINALGGDVFLIANTVENSGTISAPQGTVGLAAGSSVRLVPAGNERVSVLAGNANGAAANGVLNSGTIEGASAELKAAGGNIYALAINNEGAIRANSIVNEGGHVYLRASGGNIQNSGTISAHNADGSGGTVIMDGGHYEDLPSTVINSGTIEARGDAAGTKGGTVVMTGDHVGLFDHAVVDVSGDHGGGTALIGGDAHGGNPNVQNADRTYVDADAIIRADALSLGNGGKVVVWANDITRYFGSLSARGASEDGLGGFAEVSGHTLGFNGTANLLGGHGTAGTLLLDPHNITIQTGGTDPLPSQTIAFGNNAGGDVTFSPTAIVNALNTANVTLQANTDITIANAIDASANVNNFGLILQAGRNISIQANVTLRGSFTATANDTTAMDTQRDNGPATFTMTAGTLIDTHLQNGDVQITLSTGPGSGHNSGNITIGSLNAGNGNVLIVNHGSTDNSSIRAASAASLITANSVALDVNNAANAGGTIGTVALPIRVTTSALDARTLSGDILITSPNQGLSIGGAVLASGFTGIQDGGDLTLSAKGSINQTEAINVGGDSSFTLSPSGGDVILQNPGNQLGNVTVAGADNDVKIRNLSDNASITFPTTLNDLTLQFDNSSISLPGLTLSGALSVTAGGDITFNHDVTATSVFAHSGIDGSGNIIFANPAGGVNINADSQTYQAGNGGSTAVVDFHHSNSSTDPNFHGTTTTTATTFVYEQDHSIANTDLPDAGQLGTSATTGPTSYTIQSDGGTVDLGPMTLAGALQVTAHGSITETGGPLDVRSGASTFTVTAAGSDVVLGQANHFGGQTVKINTSGAGTVHDITYHNVDASALAPVMPGSFHTLTLTLENAAVNLPTLTLSGALNVTAGGLVDFVGSGATTVSGNMSITTTTGGINDSGSGSLTVSGTSSLSASGAGNDIRLDNSGNNFNTVVITSGHDVTLNDSGGINLGNLGTINNLTVTAGGLVDFVGAGVSTIGGTLDVTTTAGGINDSGAGSLTVNGTSTLAAGSGNDITLDNANNNFSTVVVNSGHNVTLGDSGAINLGNLGTINNLTVTAGGLVDFVGAGVSTVNGTLGITTTAGGITDSGAGSLTVSGTSTLAAGAANDITLDNANNNFNTVAVTSGHDVTLTDSDGINLGNLSGIHNLSVTAGGLVDFTGSGASTIGGTLGITTTAGGINDSGSGSIAVTGTSTLAAGAGNDITLDNANNNFSTVVISSARDVTLKDTSGLNLDTLTVRNLTVTAGGLVDFIGSGASTISGALGITTTAGGITDSGSGSLAVTGTSTLAAGSGNDITLDNANNFGTVVINSGRNVTLNDINALTVGGTLSGNLVTTSGGDTTFNTLTTSGGGITATAGGNIIGNGVITANNGPSTFTVNGVVGNVLLSQANHFGSQTVTITSSGVGGGINDINFHNVDSGALFPVIPTALHTLTLTMENAAINLPTLTLSGDLIVTAGGLVDFVGAGATTVSGDLSITTTAGGINDSGVGSLTVSGTSTLSATGAGNDITLDNANDFNTVVINNGHDVRLNDVGGINLGNLSGIHNLNVTAAGLVDFTGSGASTIGGTLDVTTTAGGISDSGSGSLTVSGTATLAAGSGNDITLDNNNNDFNTVTIASAQNVTLKDVNAINLGNVNIAGNLGVTAGGLVDFVGSGVSTIGTLDVTTTAGGISDSGSGSLTVSGTSTLAAGSGNDITLDNANNNFNTVVVNSGHNVTLNDSGTINLGNLGTINNLTVTAGGLVDFTGAGVSTIGGTLNVTTTAGGISDSGAGSLTVSGTSTLNATGAGNDITLDNVNNDFGTVVASGHNISLRDASDIDLGNTTASGTLQVTAHGNITESGALTVTSGSSTFTVDSVTGDVLLGNQLNDFGNQTVSFNAINGGSVRDVALRNVNASAAFPTLPGGLRNLFLQFDAAPITIASSLAVSGQMNLIAGGAVTETAGATITAPELSIRTTTVGDGDVTLNNANHVGTLAVDAQGEIKFKDAAGIELKIDTITEGVTAHDVVGIVSHGKNITLTADDFDIEAQIDASLNGARASASDLVGGGTVRLQPVTGGQKIHFGNNHEDNSMNFSQAELDRIAAHELFVGSVGTVDAGDSSGTHNTGRPGDDGKFHFDIPFDNDHVLNAGRRGASATVANQLSSLLAGAILPIPRLEVTSFSGSGIDSADAAKMMEPDAIGTLFLQVPFVPVEEKKYKVEEISKWTAGRIAASGTTAGPQSPR